MIPKLFALLSALVIITIQSKDVPQISQQSVQAAPGSKVTITVGEQNGFSYKVNGETASPYKISVAGDYFNDPAAPWRGFVKLYLVVDPAIYGYYRWDIIPPPNDNVLQIRIWNRFNAEFVFQVICPYPVYADQLHHNQYNATAVLIQGPSRSQA